MATLNKVFLIGNLTRDPEIRYTPKGAAVAEVGLAVNESWTNDNGEKQERVTFVDVIAWNRLAELCGQYLKKGKQAMIEGKLQMDQWEDKATGQKRSRLRVVAENIQFLSPVDSGERAGGSSAPPQRGPAGSGGSARGPHTGGGSGPPNRQQSPRPPARQDDEFGEGPITEGMEDDDIPF